MVLDNEFYYQFYYFLKSYLAGFFFHNKIDISDGINRVIASSIEVETILNYDSLDIEFALTNKNEVVIMQVRPMVFNDFMNEVPDEEIFETIKDAERKYSQGKSYSSFILGKGQLFGIMPDWNPAEIIGIKPNQLSISLYKYLIMDSTWAQQRFEYGYNRPWLRSTKPC